jgi:hypothetical protein
MAQSLLRQHAKQRLRLERRNQQQVLVRFQASDSLHNRRERFAPAPDFLPHI